MFNYMLSNIKRPVFRPLKTIASALWHLLLSPPAFAILFFGVCPLIQHLLFHLLVCCPIFHHLLFSLPAFTIHPLWFTLPSGVCYSTFWVFLSAFRRLLFCPSPYSPTFTVLPSGVYLSAIQRILLSPPMSAILFFGVCHPYPVFAVPSSGICYSPFRHLLFRLLFSFCGHSFKNPPTYAHA